MSTPTLKTIAKATGFSVTTVSRALGGYDDVNEKTRELILEEANRQGYVPNLNARLLQKQRTQTIGLIMPFMHPRLTDPFFSEFVAGISSGAATAGYDLLISTDMTDTTEMETYRRLVSRGRVDGMVLVRTRHNDPRIAYLLQTKLPFVVFGRTDYPDKFTYIDMDGVVAQRLLTEHFIHYGHRRIAYASPPAHLMFAGYRIAGYRAALAAHGIQFDDALLISGELTERSGRDIAEHLLNLPEPPTAIMTGNDLMAFGVMRAIQERGLRVGKDIAVGGFDDIPLAEHIHPGLTTIHQPIYETGQRLVTLLVQMMNGDMSPPRAILLEPELIIRASSGSVR